MRPSTCGFKSDERLARRRAAPVAQYPCRKRWQAPRPLPPALAATARPPATARLPPPPVSAGPAASPAPMSAARTASRSQQAAQTPGASVMQTPHSLGLNPSQQLGTGLRGVSSQPQPTPASMRRPDLGHYVGFRGAPGSASRRTSLAPSVSSGLQCFRQGRKHARPRGSASCGQPAASCWPGFAQGSGACTTSGHGVHQGTSWSNDMLLCAAPRSEAIMSMPGWPSRARLLA